MEVLGLCNHHTERFLYEQVGGQGNVEVLGLHNFYTERFLYEQVMWRFEGYITSTQSGFSMNRWVRGQGNVVVFRAITTSERAVKNEENILTKRTR